MSTSGNSSGAGACNCGTGPETDPVLTNLPGLSALTYRVGTYSTFLRRMLEQLPQQEVPPGQPTATSRPLAQLTGRAATDPTMALLDAWAMVMDVLSFYQERIVNEGYLRTATERVSVLELGRGTGHELHPGVAATTYLAFTADDTANSPEIAAIPQGTKVQSLPGPGELPQTFETLKDFGARATWNQLRPRTTQAQSLRLTGTGSSMLLEGMTPDGSYQKRDCIYLSGTTLQLKAGDVLLLLQRDAMGNAVKAMPVTINSVEIDQPARRTRVNLAPNAPTTTPLARETPSTPGQVTVTPLLLNRQNVKGNIVDRFWNESDLRALLVVQRWNEKELLKFVAQIVAETPDSIEVYAMRQHTSFFGSSAPIYSTLDRPANPAGSQRYPYTSGANFLWDDSNARPIWRRSTVLSTTVPDYKYYSADFGADIFLERTIPELVAGSLVLFLSQLDPAVYYVRGTVESALNEFSVSGKSTGLKLALLGTPTAALANNGVEKPDGLTFRSTVAYVQSERLPLAPLTVSEDVGGSSGSVVLDGMALGLTIGQPVWLHGALSEAPTVVQDEILTLASISHDHGLTTLGFSSTPRYAYRRSSVTINANVVQASHGETAQVEILGSGDARQQNQRFVLKKTHVTFLPAPTKSGTQSTVQLTVNGVPWKELPSLFEQDGRSESYTLRNEDDGTTTVVFGDGENGARLPSGRENVVATYRTCDAAAGSIAAGRLSLLKTRPLGIRGAVNPLPATGNSGPETLEQGRTNAALETQLVNRIVTLEDYQGFASAFPGVGKAYARLIWNGRARIVHVTIGTLDGNPVDDRSTLKDNLIRGISAVSDPAQSVQVAFYIPRYFSVSAQVVVAAGYDGASVLAAARAALVAAFSFERRSFAQAVTAAEVAMTLQSVPGVRAVVLMRLALIEDTTSSGPPPAQLSAGDTYFDGTSSQPAQLLLLPDSGIVLVEIDE